MGRTIVWRVLPLVASTLGLAFIIWGFALNFTGHESTQSWSLIGIGAATWGATGVSLRRRG